MKIPAIVLTMVLSAATTMSAQALAGYAGVTAQSGTAAAGAAKTTDVGSNLHRKMAAAMGDAPQSTTDNASPSGTNTATGDKGTQSDAEGTASDMKGMPSGMHCKEMHSGMQGKPGMHCKRMQGMKAGCHCKDKDGKMAHGAGCCKHGQCPRMKKESGAKS